ncbi:MAG TPA: ferritin-like domain-containing protein [Thermomonospora sp.]|nr:ferritin-like domain-containing protein [Thermomonospora sp.]
MTLSDTLSDNDRWLLSFYRSSEINGALFFGRVARIVRGPLQVDVTHHFSDEAAHASYWTHCIDDLGATPIRPPRAYQDRYLDAVGLPANLMEVMAITQVFEKRVISQYRRHLRHPGTHPRVRQTIERIMRDERWHVQYVRQALEEMSGRYGEERIAETLARYTAADQEIYADTLREYGERMDFLAETPVPEPRERSA